MPYIPGTLLALLGGGRVLQKFLARDGKRNYEELPALRNLISRLRWEDDFLNYRKEHPNYSEYKAFKHYFTPEKIEIRSATGKAMGKIRQILG